MWQDNGLYQLQLLDLTFLKTKSLRIKLWRIALKYSAGVRLPVLWSLNADSWSKQIQVRQFSNVEDA